MKVDLPQPGSPRRRIDIVEGSSESDMMHRMQNLRLN